MRVFVSSHTPAREKLSLFWSRTQHGYGPHVVIKSIWNKASLIRWHTALVHVQTCLERLRERVEFNIRRWAFILYSPQHYDYLNNREKYSGECRTDFSYTKGNKRRNIGSFIVEVHYWNCSGLLFTGLRCITIPAKNCEKQLFYQNNVAASLRFNHKTDFFCQHLRSFKSFMTKQIHPAYTDGILTKDVLPLLPLYGHSSRIFFQFFVPCFFSCFWFISEGKKEDCSVGTECGRQRTEAGWYHTRGWGCVLWQLISGQ